MTENRWAHCDRCSRPLPHTDAELRACPPVVVGEQGPEISYPPNDETNDADLIAFLERAVASGETEK